MRPLALIPLAAAALLLSAAAGTAGTSAPVALVTAETSNEVYAVSPASGHVVRRVHLADPVTITGRPGRLAVVVDTNGPVTLLDPVTLRAVETFRFRSPQIAAYSADGSLVYVTDAASGDLAVIDPTRHRVVRRVFVGRGAHHIAVSPDGRHIWVALGETATTIVRLDATSPRAPRVVGRFHPHVASHDLVFAPDGRSVWVSSATAPLVSVYSPSGRLTATVPAGRAPQHLAVAGDRMVVTSGYGSSLEEVSLARRRVVDSTALPYGSFNLATWRGLVITTSLLDGDVTELRASDLRRVWSRHVAPEARSIAIG